MNRKEKLINALKGLIGTVCIVVTAYCLMKYLNVKFHFLDIDNKPIAIHLKYIKMLYFSIYHKRHGFNMLRIV